jgi:uncharacterized protein YkwD
MHFFRLTLFIILGFFITACSEEKASSSIEQSETIKIDVGEDKHVKVNDTLTINAREVENDNNVSSYSWKYKEETLATTRSFIYTPTSTGVHLLDFSVLYNDGQEISDSINIIVTTVDINVTIPTSIDTLKLEYLKAINNARTHTQDCRTKGSFPATTVVSWNEKLYKASYEHAQDLIFSQTFAHEGSGNESDWTGYVLNKKSDLVERSESYGYEWHTLGENLAGGISLATAEDAVNSWLLSDNHCANLMNPNFKEVGMVMLEKEGSIYINYWAQNFGTPK